MVDKRLKKLADHLVRWSVKLQKGEHVLISSCPAATPLIKEVIRSAYEVGAYPHVQLTDPEINREIMAGLQPEQAEAMYRYDTARHQEMDANIRIVALINPKEDASIPFEKREIQRIASEHQGKRKSMPRWVLCLYPTPFYANMAGMSMDDFEEYYFDVCCLNYPKFGQAMEKLRKILEDADRVHIVGPGTDISFSIKGINKKVSDGDRNVPDGEVYTAPVRDSINGTVAFNVPTLFRGERFSNIRMVFKDGKAIETHADRDKEFNAILDSYPNARYTGEFAFGMNPRVKVPVGLILFDEKINGSFHFAMGNGLDVVDNGNRCGIHWDLVCIQTPEMGGGEIYVDDVLVRKDGKFVLPELEDLNSDASFC